MTDDLHSLSGAYVVDALTEQEHRDFGVHLDRCATCREEVASLQEITPLLAETVAVEPPPSLRADILARVREAPQEPPLVAEDGGSSDGSEPAEELATVLPLRPRWRSRGAALAAAAALLVGGGITWQAVDQVTTSASDEVLAAPDARTWQTTTPDGGRVEVIRSTDMGRAVLRVEALPDPGEGQAYQAWLQDDEGSMVPAGVMTSTDSEMLLEGDVGAAVGVGLTTEPAAGSDQPTSDPVALIELT